MDKRLSTILIIDDEPSIVKINTIRFQSKGFLVESELDGKSGLEKAKIIIPDIILLDVMLPELDGLSVCKSLKLDSKTAHIPIILLSARQPEESVGESIYLTKPYCFDELYEHVKELLRSSDR